MIAEADEAQGADGAQKLSVQQLLDTAGVDISSPSSRDAVKADKARRTKDFDAGAVGNESFCAEGQNSSLTQHSSSLPQVVVDGDETIRSNTGTTQLFAASVTMNTGSNFPRGNSQDAVYLYELSLLQHAHLPQQQPVDKGEWPPPIADVLLKV